MKTPTWTDEIVKDSTCIPIYFLQRQNKLLLASTDNVLEGRIKSNRNFLGIAISGVDKINHELEIYSSALDYWFSIIKITHEILKPYPVKLVSKYLEKSVELASPELLDQKISEIFNSKVVMDALNALYVQSLNVLDQNSEEIDSKEGKVESLSD